MNAKIQDQDHTWVFLAPVSHLQLTEAVNFEFRVDQVTFIASDKLARRRKRIGLPLPVGQLRTRWYGLLGRILRTPSTLATVRRTGILKDLRKPALSLVRDELSILTLSQLGYASRHRIGVPTLSQEATPGMRHYLAIASCAPIWGEHNERVGSLQSLTLDEEWRRWQRRLFFFQLLDVIRGDIQVSNGWRNDIRNAAILAGQSQAARDLPQAFLWNVMALEALLKTRSDPSDALPDRAEALLGWVGYWQHEDLRSRIREIYDRRSALVHAGHRDNITLDDLFFTDELLLNLFNNLVRHHHIFRSKGDLNDFAKRVAAEHVLGLRPKVRPKSLQYLRRRINQREFDIY